MNILEIGKVYVTTRANNIFHPLMVLKCLERHIYCDWGEVSPEDKKANDDALQNGGRILSSYTVNGHKMWIITEAKNDSGFRESTTVLLPEEY